MRAKSFITGLMTLAAVSGAHAAAPSKLDADPPARVGRLNYLGGSVSFRPASSDAWDAAVPNRPLTTGDRVWTDDGSRAEIHVGSTVIRLSAQTELDFTSLDDNTLQLRLAQGSMNIRIRNLDDGQVYEIDTPNGAVSLGRAGEYRIDVGPDGSTSVVTVWSGSAEMTSAGSSFAVNARQQASIKGADSPTYDLVDAPGYDAWDQWCVDRDQREDNAVSARYVSREMPGYEDLDQYGHWRNVDGYGEVWSPSDQPAGWAPYHTGHWVWVDPWGWTWVDDAPWGYAPYHYGRWAYVGDGWAWIPGQIAPRPVYAPALVVFVGNPAPRPGVVVAVGGGAAVAWFALGPQEVYRPAYATSPRYVQQVNVTNVTNVTNITNVTNVTNTTNVTNVQYRNRTAPGAMTATSSTAFASARPVQSALVPVNRDLQTAPVTGTAPAIAPTRESLAPLGARGAGIKAPPAAIESRPVQAKIAPPPAPVPFAAQQQALASNGGRPLAPTQVAQLRQTTASSGSATATLVKPAAVAPSTGGLKAARPGLPTVTAATGTTSGGFVPATSAARPLTPAATPNATRVAQPPTTAQPSSATAGGARVTQPPAAGVRVNQPPSTPTTPSTPRTPSTSAKPIAPAAPAHVRTDTGSASTGAGVHKGGVSPSGTVAHPPARVTNPLGTGGHSGAANGGTSGGAPAASPATGTTAQPGSNGGAVHYRKPNGGLKAKAPPKPPVEAAPKDKEKEPAQR